MFVGTGEGASIKQNETGVSHVCVCVYAEHNKSYSSGGTIDRFVNGNERKRQVVSPKG